MSGKKHQTTEQPASGNTEPASAVVEAENASAESTGSGVPNETPVAPKKVVQTLKRNGGGGRRVLAVANINRAGGFVRAGQEFELDESEEKRLAGSFKEI